MIANFLFVLQNKKKRELHLISHTINYEQSIHLTHFSNNHKREIEVETRLVDLLTGRKKKNSILLPLFQIGGRN